MTLTVTTDAAAVTRLANAAAAQDPVVNTVFATIATAAGDDGAAAWAGHPDEVPLVLAARSGAHTAVTFTPGWHDVTALAEALGALVPAVAAVGGPVETVDLVADALGRAVTERMAERLFRLDELIAPRPTSGTARLAHDGDAAWLAEWYTAFAIEAFGRLSPGFDASRMVERGVRSSRCWIWCAADGTPLSFAVRHPAVGGVSRIGPVYTPPEQRGHGYASAATAAASRDVLDDGDVACLFTDLANPTSNRIYAALGYRPVADRAVARFD